jgi:hypothetical protein
VNVVDVVVEGISVVVVDVVVLMLGLFPPVAGVFSEFPGPVVVVVSDVDVDVVTDVVLTQFLLLSPTLAQLGSATAETAEIAITAAKMAATVRSTSIRFTLIHPPFLYSFFPTESRMDPYRSDSASSLWVTSFLETKPATGSKDP